MRHFLIAGVLVLTSAATSASQVQQLEVTQTPVNLTFLTTAHVEETLTTIARLANITIEFDATVTEAMRGAPIAEPIQVRGATLEQALTVLTSTNGLAYTVIGPRAVRIAKKA